MTLTDKHTQGDILDIYHEGFKTKGGTAGQDIGAQAFKESVLQWSSSYYVAYARILTVAATMLLVRRS